MNNPADKPPPLIAFVDERLEHSPVFTRIIVGCCLFGLKRWTHFYQKAAMVRAVRSRRRLGKIQEFLHLMRGIAVLTFADVPSDLYRMSEIDGTADIPNMSRTDNLWAMAILSAVTSAVAWRPPPGNIDLYFDRKDLKIAHRAQFENILRHTLPMIAMESATKDKSGFRSNHHVFQFSTIKAIDKPEKGSELNEFQRGTDMAHLLCSQASDIIVQGSTGLILVKNHTTVTRSMVNKFLSSPHRDRVTSKNQTVI